jgi:hypothetical protein
VPLVSGFVDVAAIAPTDCAFGRYDDFEPCWRMRSGEYCLGPLRYSDCLGPMDDDRGGSPVDPAGVHHLGVEKEEEEEVACGLGCGCGRGRSRGRSRGRGRGRGRGRALGGASVCILPRRTIGTEYDATACRSSATSSRDASAAGVGAGAGAGGGVGGGTNVGVGSGDGSGGESYRVES